LDGLGSIISTTTVVNIVNADGTIYTSPTTIPPDQAPNNGQSNQTTYLVVIILSVLIGAGLIAVGLYFLIKRIRLRSVQVHAGNPDLNHKEMELSNMQKSKDFMPNASNERLEIFYESPPKGSTSRRSTTNRSIPLSLN
jgi:hypothetical protein